MERKVLWQFFVSAASLVFGLGLEVYFPQVRNAVCTALPSIRMSDFGNYGTSDSIEPNDNNNQRIK
jgi:hypothetical protein